MGDMFKGKMKIIMIISTGLIIVGGIIGFIGFAAMGFNPERIYMSGEQYAATYETTEQTFLVAKHDFENIDLDIDSGDIEIVKATGQDVKIKLSMRKFNSEIDNNTLLISENEFQIEEYKWYRIFNSINVPSLKIKVEIPKEFTGNINIKDSYGDVEVLDVYGSENLSIENGSGDIRISNIYIKGDMSLHTNYGGITISESIADGNVSIDNKSGDFKIEGFKGEDLKVNSSYGDSTLYNLNVKNISLASSSGAVNLDNVNVEKDIECDLKYGDLKLDKVASSRIILKSQSGDIRGTIAGNEDDYRIASTTQSGDNNLGIKHTGNKELEVNTKYGDVNIRFLEN